MSALLILHFFRVASPKQKAAFQNSPFVQFCVYISCIFKFIIRRLYFNDLRFGKCNRAQVLISFFLHFLINPVVAFQHFLKNYQFLFGSLTLHVKLIQAIIESVPFFNSKHIAFVSPFSKILCLQKLKVFTSKALQLKQF